MDENSGCIEKKCNECSSISVSNKDSSTKKPIKRLNQIPSDITDNEHINNAIKLLPPNYNFEMHKIIHRTRTLKCQKVALQFPDGLQIFSPVISQIISKFGSETGETIEVIILADIIQGACCIDDIPCRGVNVDLLVHFGHSCLVPVNQMIDGLKVLQIFVDIKLDSQSIAGVIKDNFSGVIHLMGVIQYNKTLFEVKQQAEQMVNAENESINKLDSDQKPSKKLEIIIPSGKPRVNGEVLGCTSQTLPPSSTVVFISDGRFHIESTMVQNPTCTFYLVDPMDKTLTQEWYDHDLMYRLRSESIEKARTSQVFCVILGTLGRQGNTGIMKRISSLLDTKKLEQIVVCSSEINHEILGTQEEVDCFVQIGCPRLSMDWGHEVNKPMLNPYEFFMAMRNQSVVNNQQMDQYRSDGGEWTNFYKE